MTETWISGCVKRPGAPAKAGYAGKPARNPSVDISGIIYHSMEGYRAGAYSVLDDVNRRASWTISVYKSGPSEQHYPLEAVTWHAGTYEGNVTLVGIEHEGVKGEALTAHQMAESARITRELMVACPRIVAERKKGLWEHNEIGQTSCPNGRIPWPELIAAISATEEEPMILVSPDGRNELFSLDGVHITDVAEYQALVAAAGGKVTVKKLPRTDPFWKHRMFTFPNGLPAEYLA